MRYLIVYIGILTGLLIPNICSATSDTLEIKNLLKSAYFYSNSEESYLPLLDQKNFNGNAIHFELKEEHTGLLLYVKTDQSLTLFTGNQLLEHLDEGESLIYKTDSLIKLYGSPLKITCYASRLTPGRLQAKLLAIGSTQESFLEDEEVIVLQQRRNKSGFTNFILVGIILITSYLAIVYNNYPKVTLEFFKLSRALSVREIDENLLKSRPFTRINLVFYVLYSFVAAYLLIALFYLAPFELGTKLDSLGSYLFYWIQISAVILGWIFVKFLVVRNFTALFNIKLFLPSHYFNYIRIGLSLFIFMIGVVLISYFGFNIQSESYFQTIFMLLLIGVTLRTLSIMFKLMNSASYKFLHLFSYLCGTELIPLGLILYLGLNQPF